MSIYVLYCFVTALFLRLCEREAAEFNKGRSPVMVYAPNSTLDPIAIQAGQDIRQILYEAEGTGEMHAYVNYAHGDESLEEMYGYEKWRLKKLRELKSVHDPEGKFGFYAPIH